MSTPTNEPFGQPQQPPPAPAHSGYGAAPVYPTYGAPGLAPQQPAYAPPWTPAPGGFAAALDPRPVVRSKTLGRVAFFLGLFAAVVSPVLIAVGFGPIAPLLVQRVDRGADPFGDLGWLAPFAGFELLAELALYAGTISGIAAIVAGIIAAAQKRGRAWGVWGMILGIIAPVIVAVVLFVMLIAAAAAHLS